MFRQRKSITTHTTRAALALLLMTASAAGQSPGAPQPLAPGQTLECVMRGDEAHSYRIELQKGEFFQVRVEQKTLGVTLRLLDEAGVVVAAMNGPRWGRGPKSLTFIARRGGAFALEVTKIPGQGEGGEYAIGREVARRPTAKDRRRVEVERLFAEGMAADDAEGREEVAIRKLSAALAGWREMADAHMVRVTALELASTLSAEAKKAGGRGAFRIALARFKEAILLFRELGAEIDEAEALSYAALLLDSEVFGDRAEAARLFERALALYREKGWKFKEAETLKRIAEGHANAGESRKALEYFGHAAQLFREEGLKSSEARALQNMGAAYERLGEPRQALELYRQSLSVCKEGESKVCEADVLIMIGRLRAELLGEAQTYLDHLTLASQLFKEAGSKEGEIAALSLIGDFYANLGQTQKALELYHEVLNFHKEDGDKLGEAEALNYIAQVYINTGESRKGLGLLRQALALRRASESDDGEKVAQAALLHNMAMAHVDLKEYREALETFDRSLVLFRAAGHKPREAYTLLGVAYVYNAKGQRGRARALLARALSTFRDVGYKEGEMDALHALGKFHKDAGASEHALTYYHQALALSTPVGFKGHKAGILEGLMEAWATLGNRGLAVFYGKQSVNIYQELRQAIRALDKKTQVTFLKKLEPAYRELADILIADGRIVEAEQVLQMLKEEEVFDYLRRDASEIGQLQQRADLKAEERAALDRYNEIADRITSLGAELGALQQLQGKGVKLTSEQEKRYDELSAQIEAASQSFQVFLRQLADEFSKRPNTERDLQENLALQADLKAWGDGIVFLYTLVGEDRYRVILVTPDTQTDAKYEIKAAELNRKLAEFRQAVQNPRTDPRPLGKELYDILIRPVEKHLDGARAKTLLWSLDGNLRLLPLAALWDGQQYFGQKYQNVTITLASRTRLGDAATSNWSALAVGVSEARRVEVEEAGGTRRDIPFSALPAVRTELSSIIQSEQSPKGVMPGRSLLDAEFNESALVTQLPRGYRVVHIASHFHLDPGDATRSFLLLGDGNVLTVERMRNNPRFRFDGVELLTLSACQTAVVEKDSTGKEIEGFGYVAQQKGARAILATLWSVADESTSELMSEFYRQRKENPRMTKAEALQVAQRAIIEGRLSVAVGGGEEGRGSKMAGATGQDTKQPAFPFDKSKPYAHPYYWSPFVLIGNWK